MYYTQSNTCVSKPENLHFVQDFKSNLAWVTDLFKKGKILYNKKNVKV